MVINEERSHDEFVRFLATHSSKLMSFIRIITMNHHDDAEEVFQRTCMVLWQKFSQFDGQNFAAWACRIAQFEMLKHREAKGRYKVLHDDTIEQLALASLPIVEELSDRRSALANCLKKLPNQDHDLIRQRYFDERSVNEIAVRLERSSYAIYRELSRIHGILSRCIDRTLNEGMQ